jgi:hypothetical protein
MPRLTQRVRLLYDLLFSSYFACLVVTEEVLKPTGSVFLGSNRLGYPLFQLYRLLAYLHHRPSFFPGIYRHTDLMECLLAVILFVALRLLGRIRLVRSLLFHASGFVAVAGFPLIWLHLGNESGLSPAAFWCLLLEVIAMIVCVLLYAYRAWPTSPVLGAFALALHYGLWIWIRWWPDSAAFWAFHLLGFLTALVWGLQIRLPAAPGLAPKVGAG